MKKITSWIAIVTISLLALGLSIEYNAFNLRNYTRAFTSYGVVEETGKTIEELEAISKDIIVYLKNKGGNERLTPYFNQREVMHMEDVQVLFRALRLLNIGLLSLLLYLTYRLSKSKADLRPIYIGLNANYILLALLIGLIMKGSFNKYFTYFHLIFFTNDLWLLDPATDLMIQMMPLEFFIDFASKIALGYILGILVLQLGLLWINKNRIGQKLK